jgi:hypothetical protein
MTDIPISPEIIMNLARSIEISSLATSSIREISHLVDVIERKTDVRFVRMEMGIPGLPAPSIGIEAEIKALRDGVASIYPNITGIVPLKKETSRFIKLFLDIPKVAFPP